METGKPFRWLGVSATWLVVVAAAAIIWLWKMPTVQLLSVQSGSMQPLISKGDAVLIESVKPADVHVGDIISYRSAVDSKLVITHRVLVVNAQAGMLVTKGDNNLTPDKPVNDAAIIGRVHQRIVHLGYVVDALRSTTGLLLLIYVPTLIAVVFEMRHLIRYFEPTYRLRGW